ncbi:MAG: hypothetical protein NWF04_01095 [Candidatus Bathyarchaeota archaeon]|nr:hypothetical protein [Candidatus Bathyarchaeota archaeon]
MKQRSLIITVTAILLVVSVPFVLFSEASTAAAAMTPLASVDATASGTNPELIGLDVFTNTGGVGSNVNSGPYVPQSIVQICAEVTYRNVSLVNQDVAFSVNYPNGSRAFFRSARTDSAGLALFDFRMPAANVAESEGIFGLWSVTASVDVADVNLGDVAFFPLNKMNTFSLIQADGLINRGETFKITLDMSTLKDSFLWSDLDITVFDHEQVPLGFFTQKNTPASQDETTITATIYIPEWAFTGQATAHICFLSDSSDSNSVPLTPEVIYTFLIRS